MSSSSSVARSRTCTVHACSEARATLVYACRLLCAHGAACSRVPACARAGNGVLHRDLKPSNVFVDRRNLCRLGDYGIASFASDAGSVRPASPKLPTPNPSL